MSKHRDLAKVAQNVNINPWGWEVWLGMKWKQLQLVNAPKSCLVVRVASQLTEQLEDLPQGLRRMLAFLTDWSLRVRWMGQ